MEIWIMLIRGAACVVLRPSLMMTGVALAIWAGLMFIHAFVVAAGATFWSWPITFAIVFFGVMIVNIIRVLSRPGY